MTTELLIEDALKTARKTLADLREARQAIFGAMPREIKKFTGDRSTLEELEVRFEGHDYLILYSWTWEYDSEEGYSVNAEIEEICKAEIEQEEWGLPLTSIDNQTYDFLLKMAGEEAVLLLSEESRDDFQPHKI